jgi:hypothetical protein
MEHDLYENIRDIDICTKFEMLKNPARKQAGEKPAPDYLGKT